LNRTEIAGCAPWELAEHLKNHAMCDAFLTVAECRYPDMLERVRENVSRAMSSWMSQDGYRTDVSWSGQDECFVGRLRNLGDGSVSFRGKTPAEVQDAFRKVVQERITARSA
jgi:hypothetical protein